MYSRLVAENSQDGKEKMFLKKDNNNKYVIEQDMYNKIPGMVYAYWQGEKFVNIFDKSVKLGEIAFPKQGLHTGDNNEYLRLWSEVNKNEINFSEQNSWKL